MSDDDFEIEEEESDNVCAEEDDRDHEGVKPLGPGRGRAKKPNRKKAEKINYRNTVFSRMKPRQCLSWIVSQNIPMEFLLREVA